jgi:hypothetical protein
VGGGLIELTEAASPERQSSEPPTRASTLLLTDVEGSTPLWETEPDTTKLLE